MSKRKVILAAPQELYTFFLGYFPQWDWQRQVEDVNSIWEGLVSQDPRMQLSPESDIIILWDELYKQDPASFTQAAAEFAPHALVLILSYEPDLQDAITNDILAQDRSISYRKETGRQAPFYFIDSQNPLGEIEETVGTYDHGEEAAETFRRENASSATDINVSEEVTPHHSFTRNGKVITVTSPKGGSGKSTVALLVASYLALSSKKAYEAGDTEEPLRVCIVDLDTFDGQLGFVLNVDRPTALNIALSEKAFNEELIYSNLIYSERMGFHALLAPRRGHTAQFTNPDFYYKVIRSLTQMFDVVVLDTSVQHYDALIKNVALPIADVILAITTLDIKAVKGLARWVKTAGESKSEGGHGVDMGKVGMVVNGSIHGVGIGKEELFAAAAGIEPLVSIPLDTKAVQTAGNAGRLEELLLSHVSISKAYQKLAMDLAHSILSNPPLRPLLDEGSEDMAQLERFNSRPSGGEVALVPKNRGGAVQKSEPKPRFGFLRKKSK